MGRDFCSPAGNIQRWRYLDYWIDGWIIGTDSGSVFSWKMCIRDRNTGDGSGGKTVSGAGLCRCDEAAGETGRDDGVVGISVVSYDDSLISVGLGSLDNVLYAVVYGVNSLGNGVVNARCV